ncbi:1-deoxy-D-xylulose-5-phosphate reductoisomerase [Facilibium subflavum]|uniref:1-deoxy-D-xylulose-5-phosphate reductoisomerase n=1 Tax=Facilibium subflavum TaxID=2219058 RepID=UPI000E6477D8|nr:1-deoxy-D-xylulose-5-phosphate reductoisomerase [Facilibium subflavum]
MKNITILGATGSIGQNTLSIIADNPYDFSVYALSAHTQIDRLFTQCLQFSPKYAVVANKDLAAQLTTKLKAQNSTTTVLYGQKALIDIACDDAVDMVMAAIVGIAGLTPTYEAIKKGKKILLANKESLVTAGHLFMAAVEKYNALLLPVDSEHNAIFQCLSSFNKKADKGAVEKIILTASGGPFRQKTLAELQHVTPDEACAHPNWSMGRKISVDSSTMMNKALEVIEAYWLFGMPIENIEVLIHPQSIVHSMVKYCDGSFIAQMGTPDMKTPIGYAMYYPKRHFIDVPNLDFTQKALTFEQVDLSRFGALKIVFTLLKNKDYAGNIVFNAANEVLVEAFLSGQIKYLEIIDYIEKALSKANFNAPGDIDEVIAIDQQTRLLVNDFFA